MDNGQESSRLKLDELDLTLVKELELDPRQTNLDLAAKLGTSSPTIQRRLKRLLDAKVILVTAFTEPLAMGFETRAVVGAKISADRAVAAIDHLGCSKNVRSLNIVTTGRYDMLVSTMFHNKQELQRFIGTELGETPGLVNAEVMMLLETKKNSWMYLNGDKSPANGFEPWDLDETDLRLVRELELNPRNSITNLAQKLGMSRPFIRRKLQALLSQKIVTPICVVNDLAAFGFGVQAAIFVKAHPSRISAVADALVSHGRVNHVIVLSGRFDIGLWATFADLEGMSDFLSNYLSGIPGVISHETMVQKAFQRRSFVLVTRW